MLLPDPPANDTARRRPRVLAVGQAVRPTGYARVFHSLFSHLAADFEISHFGINYKGPAVEGRWRVIPNELLGDVLGREQLPGLLQRLRPDLVFLCHDDGFYDVHRAALGAPGRSWKTVFYCPVEWPRLDPRLIASFDGLDRLVLYTEFGRRAMECAARRSTARLPEPAVLPHGVDATRFHPIAGGRRLARRRLFPERPELEGAFIVLNANRNVKRKRVDLTLRAFAAFARDKPDARLYLHMGMRDFGVDVRAIAAELGVADKLLCTTEGADRPSIDDERLNLVYNACDVGINTAVGEGWGLVAFEHAATGAAQLVPAHSACAELWRSAGTVLPLAPCDDPEGWGAVAIEPAAAALEALYRDRALLAERSRAAFEHARSAAYRWETIAASWRALFHALLDERG